MREKELIQIQEQIFINDYDRLIIHRSLHNALEGFEKYIEMSSFFTSEEWLNRKQYGDNNIKRKDIDSPERAKKLFSTVLFGFKKMTEDNPEYIMNELKEEFEYGLIVTGLGDSEEIILQEIIHEFNEILEGRGERIVQEALNRKRKFSVNSPEYAEELNKAFASIQEPLEKSRKEEKFIKENGGKKLQRFGGGIRKSLSKKKKKIFDGMGNFRNHNIGSIKGLFFEQRKNEEEDYYDDLT